MMLKILLLLLYPSISFASEGTDGQDILLISIGAVALVVIHRLYKTYGAEESKRAAEQRVVILAKKEQEKAERERIKKNELKQQEEQERLERERELELQKDKDELVANLKNGQLPEVPQEAYDNLPFAFSKNERMIFGWKNVLVKTIKRKRRMVGATGGLSFRVAKGVTLRTGGLSGHSESYEEECSLGYCLVVITDKNIFIRTQDQRIKKCSTKQIIGVQSDANLIKVEFSRLLPLVFILDCNEAYIFKEAALFNLRNFD